MRYVYLKVKRNPDRTRGVGSQQSAGQEKALSETSIDNDIYDKQAAYWWDPQSAFSSGLHAMTRLRAPFFVEHSIRTLTDQRIIDPQTAAKPLRIVDIGCGGGILSEAVVLYLRRHFPRLFSHVSLLGVDLAPGAVSVARRHALENPNLALEGKGDKEKQTFPLSLQYKI